MGVTLGDQPCLDPLAVWNAARTAIPPWPVDNWTGKPNAFSSYVGSKPGKGYVLLSGQSLNQLDLNSLQTLQFNILDQVSGETTTVPLLSLVIVRAECIVPGADPQSQGIAFAEDAPYLVELADRRKLYCGIPIDKAYNVRQTISASGYYSATRNGGSDWTWTTMVTDIWNAVGKLGSFPDLPFTPDGTPENFIFYGGSAWHALETVLRRIGCALNLDLLTDTFSIVQLGSSGTQEDISGGVSDAPASAENDERERLIWDKRTVESVRANVPASLRVKFRRFPAPTDGSTPWYHIDLADPTSEEVTGAEPGSYVQVNDDMFALYNGSGALQNGAALTSRANDRANDFFRQLHNLEPAHRVYGGVLDDLIPSGTIIGTRWEDRGTGYKTEFIRYSSVPDCTDPDGECCGPVSIDEYMELAYGTGPGGGSGGRPGPINWPSTPASFPGPGPYNNYPKPNTPKLLVTCTGDQVLTGISGGSAGDVVEIWNSESSTGTLTIPHQSGSSSAGNEFWCPDLWSNVLQPGGGLWAQYDGSNWNAVMVPTPCDYSTGYPTATSVDGNLALDTSAGTGDSFSPNTAAVYVWNGDPQWWPLAGGGIQTRTGATYTLALASYTTMDVFAPASGTGTWTYPTGGSALPSWWHHFLYNNSGVGSPATLQLKVGAGAFGTIFVGGGGSTFTDGSGNYYAWGVEQYRTRKTISTTTYTLLPGDENLILVFTNAQGCAVTVPQSTTAGNFSAGFRCCIVNQCAGSTSSPYGVVTLTPSTSTANDTTALTVFPYQSVDLVADGTNYSTENGRGPTGVVEWSSSTLTLTAAHFGKLLSYTGSVNTTVSGDGNLQPGFWCYIRHAGSTTTVVVQYAKAGGGNDYIPPFQAVKLVVPDTQDAATNHWEMTGVTMFGARGSSSSPVTVTRADKGRNVYYSGSGTSTLALFSVTSDDVTFACQPSNWSSTSGTGGNMTITVAAGQKLNGVLNGTFLLAPGRGTWAFVEPDASGWRLCDTPCPLFSGGSSGTIGLGVSGGTDLTFDLMVNSVDPLLYLTNDGFCAQYATLYAGGVGSLWNALAPPTTNGFWVYNSLVTAAAAVAPQWSNLAGAAGLVLTGAGATSTPKMSATPGAFPARLQVDSTTQISLQYYKGQFIDVNGSAVDPTGSGFTLASSAHLIDSTGADTGAGPSASTLYYCYVSNASASFAASGIRLSATSPSLVNGVKYLNTSGNALNWRFVGFVRLDGSSHFQDSATQRFCINYYNQRRLALYANPGYADGNSATTYTTAATQWAEANAGTGSKVEFLSDGESGVEYNATAIGSISVGGGALLFGVGEDSSTSASISSDSTPAAGVLQSLACGRPFGGSSQPPAVGYHYLDLLICVGAGTGTYYADIGRTAGDSHDVAATCLRASVMG